MPDDDVDDLAEATETNWLQGSLLPADLAIQPLQWVHPDAPATKIARGAVRTAEQRARRDGGDGVVSEMLLVPGGLKEGDRMMVLTQTCDLVKPPEELSQVEVGRVFTTRSDRTIAEANDFGSARYQRVSEPDADPVLVLDYGRRALLDKGVLQSVEPDNSVVADWSSERAQTVARWLGRRYSRPAIPDKDYDEITRPVRERWIVLVDEEPELAREISEEYPEMRFRRDGEKIVIYVLSRNQHPSEELALELIGILSEALEPVHGADGLDFPTDRRSYYTFRKHDELTTLPLDMEWASHEEGEPTGALPPG